ncbi:MAG: 3-oxoacyl-ACP reductase, partial [Chloroflexota bacterium]
MLNDSLEGRIAVVTGGGGGIGSAICRRLAEAG